MQNVLRAAADALADLAERAHGWADRADGWAAALDSAGAEAPAFAGLDLVGIDFSTSIQAVASHVIHGWDRYRRQAEALRADRGVWAFGVNAVVFPLTRGPVPPRWLPALRAEHFRRRGDGRGLVEYGSAFYDYFAVALGHARDWAAPDEGRGLPGPVTVGLLCDGLPNGGAYRSGDVRPLVAAARARGVRFKVAGFVRREYRAAMRQFRDSLGLTAEELEIAWYDTGAPDEPTIDSGFLSLSRL
jgi:hypothetical protein